MIRRLIPLLPTVLSAAAVLAGDVIFDTPSDDAWQYPFTPDPGGRGFASCFGSTADPNFTTFNDRDGIFLIAWRTDEDFCGGLPPGAYDIQSVRVTLTGAVCSLCPTPDWLVDLTTDPWFNLDYPVTDADPGQPLELFGVGFGPEYTYANWTERAQYVGGDQEFYDERDPFPFVFQDGTGNLVHVEDSVKDQFTPTPWATGVPVKYAPGRQTSPFPVHFDVDLALSDGRVLRYFQEQLSAGRVVVVVTSLTVTFKQAATGFPSFFTKEGLSLNPQQAKAPRLTIVLAASGNPDGDSDRDKRDWRELAHCLAGPEAPPDEGGMLTAVECLCVFDFDEDGDVDLEDVSRFAARFTGGE